GVPQDGGHLALPIINALAQGAAVHTQLQVLAFLVGHGQVFGHADSEGQVATQLPHKHRGSYVAGVHLHVAATLPLHDTQALGVAVPTTGAAIHKGSWQVICHSLVYFLICTLAVGFEDDRDLWEGTRTKFNTMGGEADGVSFCSKSAPPFWRPRLERESSNSAHLLLSHKGVASMLGKIKSPLYLEILTQI
uniref:Uncharacterized protein n=2 Tax=Equus asinus TaxID=9793 RepID=A0A9L0JN19_EQUAS